MQKIEFEQNLKSTRFLIVSSKLVVVSHNHTGYTHGDGQTKIDQDRPEMPDGTLQSLGFTETAVVETMYRSILDV